jgi:tetratricopeptide (TPR) repeat protein
MHDVILTVLLVAIGFMIFRFGRNGRREFEPKISERERTEIVKKVEKDHSESSTKSDNEQLKTIPKSVLPSKNFTLELNRFKSHYDNESVELIQFMRNGIQKSNAQNYRGALEDFSHAVELKPFEPTVHYCRGIVKLILKNFESSISDFSEAIRLQINEQNVFFYRGLANYGAKDFDSAILDLSRFVQSASSFAEAYFNLALCYKQKRDYQKAIRFFTETINKNPRHEVAYFERGLLKDKVGDKEGCSNDLKKAMDMGHLEAYHYIKELCEKES